ncbi:MAG TPA: MFS transporter [Acidimicrobiales bacterium]|nr:MFS transporter [Acidimicrobiales bacterium]
MAVAIGVIVANLYYLQPLLHQIRHDFHASTANTSLLMTLVQAGYAAGLAFVVPMGDLIPRRRLVVGIFLFSSVMMAVGALLSSFALFAVVSFVIGITSVGGQVIIPLAADLAVPTQRGRVIARVMTGLLMGILLSRIVSGLVAQVAGWRAVYWGAAGLLTFMALVLHRALPDEPTRPHVRYRTLVASSFSLLVTLPQLRRRAWFGALIFAGFSAVWTTLSFHLAAAPFHYSNAVIGLFGLFGVAGVLAANLAGHHADRQRSHVSTIIAALFFLLAFAILSFGRNNFWSMALGLLILDAGMQGLQITNQSIIYALLPSARSRVNSAYMVCAFTGASIGSYAAGALYAAFGWTGDCWLGIGISLGLLIPALWWRNLPTTTAAA